MRVAVVMGGPSAEYEVSISSGMEVVRCFQECEGFEVRAVVITREKTFYHLDIPGRIPAPQAFLEPSTSRLFAGPFFPANAGPVWEGCAVAFLALHGSFGEDGRMQGYLDTIALPYTGSGVFASSLAMNKIATKQLLLQQGIATPPFSVIGPGHPSVHPEELAVRHGLPCFVKCPQSGSSRLMGRAADLGELQRLIVELSAESEQLLVESLIDGPEFSCAVIEMPDFTIRALPPIEIRPRHSVYFDYDAKYSDNASEEIVPAPRPESLLARIRECACEVHRLVGCTGLSRTDMILCRDILYVLETNTLPGLTRNSLLPRAFRATGGTDGELVEILIRTALAHANRRS